MRTAIETEERLLERVKRIRGHAAYARWLLEAETTGYEIARPAGIASPYAFAPTWPVYQWLMSHVVVAETAHRVYDVFSVPPERLQRVYEEGLV